MGFPINHLKLYTSNSREHKSFQNQQKLPHTSFLYGTWINSTLIDLLQEGRHKDTDSSVAST